MRIFGPSGTSQTPPKAGARRSTSSGFSIEDTSIPVETRPAAALRASSGIEALLAMQGFEDPTERRKRSVQKGRTALDVLDDLKIGLLTGALDSSMVGRLRMAAADLKSMSGDPQLDQVLSEIELRVEVELAKASQVRPVNTGV
jgi:hypothetical protein